MLAVVDSLQNSQVINSKKGTVHMDKKKSYKVGIQITNAQRLQQASYTCALETKNT